MELSTKGQYAARAMVDLALHYKGAPIQLREVAKRQQISVHYLEQLFVLLRVAGLVKSMRGAHGGFSLARPPSEIKLGEVIRTVEGSIAPVKCVDDPATCARSGFCAPRDIWVEMYEAINGVLEKTTLEDLVERQKKKGNPETSMYYI